MLKTFPKLLRDMKLCDRRVRVIVVGHRTIESSCCFGKVDDSDDMYGDDDMNGDDDDDDDENGDDDSDGDGDGDGDDDDDDDDDPWIPSF